MASTDHRPVVIEVKRNSTRNIPTKGQQAQWFTQRQHQYMHTLGTEIQSAQDLVQVTEKTAETSEVFRGHKISRRSKHKTARAKYRKIPKKHLKM